ncbi:hypothetical protein BDF19DRAFT_193584 [Syncephalis fuscata]|nr:hypothetical protein BDF19DRAFT_193584 [Syncephalis fuscata]
MPTATTMQNSISTSDCTSLLGQSRLGHAEKDASIAIGSLPALNKALGGITIEPIDLATSLPSASTIDTFVSERSDTENGDNDVCASHARHGAPIWALQDHGDDTETNAPVSWIAPLPNMALDCKVHTHKQSRTTDQSIYKQPGVTTIVSRSCTALNAVKRPANILITERPATVYLQPLTRPVIVSAHYPSHILIIQCL